MSDQPMSDQPSTMYPLVPEDSRHMLIQGESSKGVRNDRLWILTIDPTGDHKDELIDYQRKSGKVAFYAVGGLMSAFIDAGFSEDGNVLGDLKHMIETYKAEYADTKVKRHRVKDVELETTEPRVMFTEDGIKIGKSDTDHPIFTLAAYEIDAQHATLTLLGVVDFYPLNLIAINRRYLMVIEQEGDNFKSRITK